MLNLTYMLYNYECLRDVLRSSGCAEKKGLWTQVHTEQFHYCSQSHE